MSTDEPEDLIFAASRAVLIGEPEKVDIVVADYDARWPERFEIERAKIAAALGQRALAIEHIGSTSVPGLAAKPIIDICLVVSDSSDEASYVPDRSAAGFELRVREPEGMSTECFAPPNGMFTFMCSLTAQRRSVATSYSVTGSAATRLIVSHTRRPSAISARGLADDAALCRGEVRDGRSHYPEGSRRWCNVE